MDATIAAGAHKLAKALDCPTDGSWNLLSVFVRRNEAGAVIEMASPKCFFIRKGIHEPRNIMVAAPKHVTGRDDVVTGVAVSTKIVMEDEGEEVTGGFSIDEEDEA